MALMEDVQHQLREQVGALRSTARRGAVDVLRWAADRLREVDVVSEGVVSQPMASAPPAAPEAPAAPEPEAPVRVGAAALVDAAATAPSPEPVAARPAAAPSGDVHDRIVEMLHTVFDPEIPVDIYELGLIYAIDVDEDRVAHVRMTLTSPNCPSAQALPLEVEQKVATVEGIVDVDVEVVFEPPWTPDLMSEEARLHLNV